MSEGRLPVFPAQASLTVGGLTIQLPVVPSTMPFGDVAIDVTGMRDELQLEDCPVIFLDRAGLGSTGVVKSAITYIDGKRSKLLYGGYPIEQLAEKCSFEEVTHLLIHGKLPTSAQLESFSDGLRAQAHNREGRITQMIKLMADGTHPMALLSSAVTFLSGSHPGCLDPCNPEQRNLASQILLARMPQLVAAIACAKQKQPIRLIDTTKPYVYRLLLAMTGKEPSEAACQAMEVLLIMHADHEQNCSTSTVRVVGSSHVNLFASISAGISALWGPRHGGANEACLAQLRQIQSEGLTIAEVLRRVREKEMKLMGFGHRVYETMDPRAAVIEARCEQVLAELRGDDQLFQIAKQLKDAALADEYFQKRNLWPNVDFYSGIIYAALGIPEDMFTVIFALGRLPGWIAHWQETHDQKLPIFRPRQVCTGSVERDVTPIAERGV